MGGTTLASLQSALAEIYDLPATPDVREYLMTDRASLDAFGGARSSDEQLLVAEEGDTLSMALFIDASVMERLDRRDPYEGLDQENLADYLTAAEGVSHFMYVAWNTGHDKPVTLLELELQAEIDKYAAALLAGNGVGAIRARSRAVRERLFHTARFLDPPGSTEGERYRVAHRAAAKYAASLEQRFVDRGLWAELWAELRRFYRMGAREKLEHMGDPAGKLAEQGLVYRPGGDPTEQGPVYRPSGNLSESRPPPGSRR
jgi:hypothetical protein